MKKRSSAKTKPCPIANCWELIPEHKSLCTACTSWWYRMSFKTADELAIYMKKMGRIIGRQERLVRHHKRAA